MPAGPMFPRPYVPRRPFGRFVPPVALPPGFPGGYGRYLRLARFAARFLGPIGWLLTAYELWEWYNSAGNPLSAGGWMQCCALPAPKQLDAYNFGSASVNNLDPLACNINLCGTGGQVPLGPWPSTIPALVHSGTSSYRAQFLYLGIYNDPKTRMTYYEGYKRVVARSDKITPEIPGSWPEITPGGDPMPIPVTDPIIVPPWVEPFVPPGRPRPDPTSPPVRRPPPLRPPPRPEGSTGGSTDPWVGPGPRPDTVTNPEPPGPGVRERKVRASHAAARRFLGWLTGAASEAGDLLDALHDALPDELQAEGKTYADKVEALWQGWEHVDMAEAFENIWSNEVEDKYLGEFFQGVQDGMAISGVDFGGLKL